MPHIKDGFIWWASMDDENRFNTTAFKTLDDAKSFIEKNVGKSKKKGTIVNAKSGTEYRYNDPIFFKYKWKRFGRNGHYYTIYETAKSVSK